jgi:hypothetical protein
MSDIHSLLTDTYKDYFLDENMLISRLPKNRLIITRIPAIGTKKKAVMALIDMGLDISVVNAK